MDRFLKITNFQECRAAFNKWMGESYNINVSQLSDSDKNLFEIMTQVKNEYISDPDISIKDLNNISLNRLQDVYVENMGLKKGMHANQSQQINQQFQTTKTPNASSLDRDSALYGQRPMAMAQHVIPIPTNTTNKDYEDVNKQFDLIMATRAPLGQVAPPTDPFATIGVRDTPIVAPEFEKMLTSARDEYLKTNIELQRPLISESPQILYQTQHDISNKPDTAPVFSPFQQQVLTSPQETNMQQAFIKTPVKRATAKKFFTLNGFDRNWKNQPQRYSFSVDFNNFSGTYKNITKIKFPRLVIPNEIIESRTLVNQPKFVYHHDHKLAYPYLLLKVDEFSDVCDGLNKQVKDAFVQFVYCNSYRCPNGRGYVIMEPAQKEHKDCSLSAIQRLTLSIQKPNGTLFNNSLDDYSVIKVDYQCYNSLYLQIIMDKFFDKNEFYIGDSISIIGYNIYMPPAASADLSASDFTKMSTFVNRPEGHEIVQLGDANQNGFYKSFYILAPGHLDQTVGKLTVTKLMVDALREYNVANLPKINGSIINMSLQVALSMTIDTNVGDMSVLAPETV